MLGGALVEVDRLCKKVSFPYTKTVLRPEAVQVFVPFHCPVDPVHVTTAVRTGRRDARRDGRHDGSS